jgi:hypothetical protein
VGLIVDFNQDWDFHVRIAIENALRKCIPEPPKDEDWIVSLAAGFAQSYCEVSVKTPSQTRTRFFFEDPHSLPKAITDWIHLYPLR